MTIAAFATLNARLRPMDRGERYEDPLIDVLDGRAFYEVVGGGSQLLLGSNEIEYCCIDIDIHHLDQAVPLITDTLNEAGAPQGSFLAYTDQKEKRHSITFGKTVGLAIYLNGTELPPDVYSQCDVNADIISGPPLCLASKACPSFPPTPPARTESQRLFGGRLANARSSARYPKGN